MGLEGSGVMTTATQAMIDYALSKVGCGYIMGATGWICSLARRQQQAAQYEDDAARILGVGAKWDGMQCFDCAQLVRLAVEAGGGKLVSGATSQWNQGGAWSEKGPIGTMPGGPCILYRESGGKMQHTGVNLGDGWVVDARGTAEGVVKTALGSYGWTHWAIPVLGNMIGEVKEMEYPYKAVVKTKTGNGVGLWNDSGKTRLVVSVPEGAEVDVIGRPDDKGFVLATYEGYKGVMDSQYLVPVREDGGEPEAPDVDLDKLRQAYRLLGEVLGEV